MRKECIKTEISPKFKELFKFLNENEDKFEIIICSGGTTVLIEWVNLFF
jgi:2-hydroxy-3-keto-5-methylthiopentenyl-1-phosphate phosphatase